MSLQSTASRFHRCPQSTLVRRSIQVGVALLACLATQANAADIEIITGTDIGLSRVKEFDAATGDELNSFFPYTPNFTGGVRVATGDVNGDGVADIVTGAGAGSDHVKVFDGTTGSEFVSFLAYGGFTGGVYVAAGDVNNDGFADIITGSDAGAAHVRVFDGQGGGDLYSFFAYTPSFTGGVRVAAGDVNGDGKDDIITGAGPGSDHVKVFDGVNGSEIVSFLAYGGFLGGVYVAAGDVNNDGFDDIITGADAGGGLVRVFDGQTQQPLDAFFPYDTAFTGGVRVAAGDLNGDGYADIVTGAGPGGGPHIKIFDGATGRELDSFFEDPTGDGGVFVAVKTIVVPEVSTFSMLALATLGLTTLAYRRNARSSKSAE